MDAEGRTPQALFERSVRRLDAATANRLRLARRAALAGDRPSREASRGWPAALAATAVLVLGIGWWLPRDRAPVPAAPAAVAVAPDEAVLVAEGDDVELYAWLAEAPVAAEAGPERSL
jgi:hypothetical protein